MCIFVAGMALPAIKVWPCSLVLTLLLVTRVASAVKNTNGPRKSWVDPDSPDAVLTAPSLVDGRMLELVFSDEFNVRGRSFRDGHDPRWTALHKDDYTNNALHFYDHDFATTSTESTSTDPSAENSSSRLASKLGYLNITTDAQYTSFPGLNDSSRKVETRTKNFKSAMLQSWNKFCFTGGVVEVRAQLPGEWMIGGFWPAIWLMGNLARATYVGTSDWVWPWSFDKCDRSLQPKQAVSACNPYPHYGMDSFQGRGAPEIDLLEAMPGWSLQPPTSTYKPYASSSLQIAPGDSSVTRPQKGGYPQKGTWYEGLEYGNHTEQNVFFYGSATTNVRGGQRRSYQADAISGNTQLYGSTWTSFSTYRVEWQLPASDAESGLGYLRWFMNGELVFGIKGESLKRKMKSSIPSEPSYVIINNAMSATWGFPEATEFGCPAGCKCQCYDCRNTRDPQCTCGFDKGFCASLPGHFLVDYVRVWQHADDPHEKVGCSTPERPTKTWIQGHAKDYADPGSTTPLQPIVSGGGACSVIAQTRDTSSNSNAGIDGAAAAAAAAAADDYDACGYSTGRGQCIANDGSGTSSSSVVVSSFKRAWVWVQTSLQSSLWAVYSFLFKSGEDGDTAAAGNNAGKASDSESSVDDWPLGSATVEVLPPDIPPTTANPPPKPTNAPPSPSPTPPPQPFSVSNKRVQGVCRCSPDFVGPWCGASAASDPVDWATNAGTSASSSVFKSPQMPALWSTPFAFGKVLLAVAVTLVVAFGATCVLRVKSERRRREVGPSLSGGGASPTSSVNEERRRQSLEFSSSRGSHSSSRELLTGAGGRRANKAYSGLAPKVPERIERRMIGDTS